MLGLSKAKSPGTQTNFLLNTKEKNKRIRFRNKSLELQMISYMIIPAQVSFSSQVGSGMVC